MVLACDVKILKLRDMDAREEADVAQSDADYAECVDIVRCVLSNKVALHRRCPLKACIRARTCAGKGQPCLSLLTRPVIPAARAQAIIDDLYYDKQAERLAAEQAGEA